MWKNGLWGSLSRSLTFFRRTKTKVFLEQEDNHVHPNEIKDSDTSSGDLVTNPNYLLMHFNVQNLPNKIHQLQVLLSQYKPKLLCVCEHWMNDDQIQSTHLPNYKLVTSFCRKQKIHGGVAIYSQEDNWDTVKPILCDGLIRELYFECVGVCFRLNNKKIALVVIYSTSSLRSVADFNCFLKYFNDLLDYLYKQYQFVIVCGDLNVDYLKNTPYRSQLQDLFDSFAQISSSFRTH